MPSGADVTVCENQLAPQGVFLAVPKFLINHHQIQKHLTGKHRFRNDELCSGDNASAAKEGRG